jgi:hypothetical protein
VNCLLEWLLGVIITGDPHAGLEACTPLKISNPKPAIFLGWEIGELEPALKEQYQVVNVATAYSRQVQIRNFNGMLSCELTGAVLASANFIDAGAFAFLAREAGCIATALDGSPLPSLHSCSGYSRCWIYPSNETRSH